MAVRAGRAPSEPPRASRVQTPAPAATPRGAWRGSSPPPPRPVRVGLELLFAALARPDAVGLLDRHDEHLAVADLAGTGVAEDHVHDRLDVMGRDHALELDLRPQPVGQLGAAVALRDASLASRPLDLGDRQGREPEREEIHPDRFERLVPDERFHFLHYAGTSLGAVAGILGARGAAPGVT